MNVSIGERWEGFVEHIVKSGRYGSASEVVREGLRLVEERENQSSQRFVRRSTPRSQVAVRSRTTNSTPPSGPRPRSCERKAMAGEASDVPRLRPRRSSRNSCLYRRKERQRRRRRDFRS